VERCAAVSKRRFAWVALTSLGLSWTVFGAETLAVPGAGGPPEVRAVALRTLTLAEARRVAFQHNWDLLAARSDVDIATAQKIVAKEFPNPTASFSATKINTDGRPNGTVLGNSVWHRNYDSFAAINQLFEIGGKRRSRQASAAAGIEAATARLQDARRVLDLGVTQAYVTALLAETNVGILRQSATSLRREAGIAQLRLKAGDISAADEGRIENAAARLELQAKTAEASAVSARIAVEVLMGVDDPRGQWVPGDSIERLGMLDFGAEQLPPGPVRPDLVAAEAALKKAEADLRLQKALRIPDPTLLAQYERNPPDQPNTIGLGVSFPLPLWNRNRGAIRAAQAARDQAGLQVNKIKMQIAADIANTRTAYREAAARWRQQMDTIQPNSEHILQTVTFAYEKGGASLLDLLSDERDDNDVRLATAQAAADAAAAASSLKAALNLLDSNSIPQ
jgi:cobalt-zinc-cadmium efflux system outer membrane protein